SAAAGANIKCEKHRRAAGQDEFHATFLYKWVCGCVKKKNKQTEPQKMTNPQRVYHFYPLKNKPPNTKTKIL
ncbi:hypothetical protein ACTHT3_20765, partial [Neisseria sp. P0015.S004]